MKYCMALLCCLFLAAPLFSQHAVQLESWRASPTDEAGKVTAPILSLGLDSGVLFGIIGEWVFVDREADNAYDDVLSWLDWQQKPLFYAGLTGGLRRGGVFF